VLGFPHTLRFAVICDELPGVACVHLVKDKIAFANDGDGRVFDLDGLDYDFLSFLCHFFFIPFKKIVLLCSELLCDE
jgi:hypothetical protein